MKKLNLTISLAMFLLLQIHGNYSQAQQVKYQILTDDPKQVKNSFIAVEFLNIDIGGKKNLNTIGLGVNGIYTINNKIGAEGNFRYALIKSAALPLSFSFEGGGYFMFKNAEKTKPVKVRFGGDFGTSENKHVYNEKFIMVNAKHIVENSFRGGLYMHKKGYAEQDVVGKPEIPYFLTGIYGGIGVSKKVNLTVQVEGNKKETYVTGLTRIYGDLILTPVATRSFPIPAWENASTIKNKLFGFRVGASLYKDGPKWFNRFMLGLETGSRPIDGFFFRTWLGYEVYRE